MTRWIGVRLSVDLVAQRSSLALQWLQLAVDVDLRSVPIRFELVDLPLQLEQRLLEFQRVR